MDKQCQPVGRLEVSGTGVLPWVGPGEDKSNQHHFLTGSGFFSRQFSEIRLLWKDDVGVFRQVDSPNTHISHHTGDPCLLPGKLITKPLISAIFQR